MIPIDHCLISEGIRAHDARTGSFTGSDHLPLILELEIRSEDFSQKPAADRVI